jgi:formate hydrogenlyase subunit 6/NADH:ubiquinone oxidoreductase subunit I
MTETIYTITRENLYSLLADLSKDSDVYIPAEKNGHLSYEKFNPEHKDDYVVDRIRPMEPLKSFFTRSRERVDGFSHKKNSRGQVIVGVKNCDIASLRVQDLVFKNTEPVDPFFSSKRDNTTIISSDCNMLCDSCFCTALETDPYPVRGFDLNLSKEADDFLAQVGSEKGQSLVDSYEEFFGKAGESQIKDRDASREVFKNKLKSQVHEKEVPDRDEIVGSVAKRYEDTELWSHFASTCIECGGCNHCCPACHCFLLSEQKKGDLKARFKSWDACLYNRFAVVAGGANPRKHLYERLRNRFDKKFEFFQEVMGDFGCTGCGRCTEVCPGKIDIKEVLKRVVKSKD